MAYANFTHNHLQHLVLQVWSAQSWFLKDVHVLISGIYGCVLSYGTGQIRVADGIKVVNQLTSLKGECLICLGVQYNHKGPLHVEEGGRRSESERTMKMLPCWL